MTPLALAREWARGEPGLGLYLGCLAIRFVKITLKCYVNGTNFVIRKSGVGACTVVRWLIAMHILSVTN